MLTLVTRITMHLQCIEGFKSIFSESGAVLSGAYNNGDQNEVISAYVESLLIRVSTFRP